MQCSRRSGDRRRRPAAASVAVAFAVLLLGGCGGGGAPSVESRVRATLQSAGRDARANGYDEQADVLEDGTITDAEYRRLFSLFEECVARERVALDPPAVSPIDGRRMLWWPKDNVPFKTEREFDAVTRCQVRYIADADNMVIEEPRRMAEPLRRHLATCLRSKGVDLAPTDDDIRKIMSVATKEHAEDVATCISERVLELFPDIKSVPFVPPVDY